MTLIAVLALASSLQGQDAPVDPVDQALEALLGDSIAVVEGRWSADLDRNPDDPEALLALATLARLTYDYPRSDSLFRRLGTGSADNTSYRAEALRGQAHLRFIAGEMMAGDSIARLGADHAEAAADTTLWVKLLFLRLSVLRHIAGPDAEAVLLADIDRLIGPEQADFRAEWMCRSGSRLAYLGDATAYDRIRQGLDTAVARESEFVSALCHKVLAEYGVARGEVDSAIHWLGQAAMAAEAIRDDIAAATILQWRGYTNLEAGHYGPALADLQGAVRHATISKAVASEAWALLNLARIALALGDTESGMQLLDRATILLEQMGDSWGLAVAQRIEGHLAVSGGAWLEADSLYRQVLSWAEQSGLASEQLSLHEELANVAVMRKDWPAAGQHVRQGRRVARTYDLGRAANGLDYVDGLIALRQGDATTAARAFRRYAAELGPDQYAFRYTARARLAEALAQAGDLDAAERELVNAAAELDRFRGTLSDVELRRFVFQAGVDPYDVDLGVATVIHQLAMAGRIETAFMVGEGRRARELADRLLRAREIADTVGTPTDRPSPSLFVTAGEVQDALPERRMALVQFVLGQGDEPGTIFVITRDGLTAVDLAVSDRLVEDIARFVVLLESGASSTALARRLGRQLLDPVIAVLPDDVDQLLVVADGAIHRVPFDALRLEDDRWAVERFGISTVPSAAIAVHLWQRPPRNGGSAILAYGDPLFGSTSFGREAWMATRADTFGRLALSGREARRIAGYGDEGVVRLRAQATEASLKATPLEEYRVLHFATHALVDEVAVNKVALMLAPGDGEDGLVTPTELAQLTLEADLVVLSACRTAGGVVVGGEGMQGLTAPLLGAGARSIVATHWPIADQATAEVMERFYRAMSEGASVGEAIRQVKLGLIANGGASSQWASFTVVGNALVRPPLRRPRSKIAWWGAGFLVLAAAGYWGAKTIRRGVERT